METDGLRDGEDVPLVERVRKCRAAVPRRTTRLSGDSRDYSV